MSGFTDGRTLGSEMRACRLGFRWLPDVGAYLRIRDEGELLRFELRPPGALPSRERPGHHRVWWETATTRDEVRTFCRRLLAGDTRRVRLQRPTSFLLDPVDDAVTIG